MNFQTKTLLVSSNPEARNSINRLLLQRAIAPVEEITELQTAIETIERDPREISLVICDYRSESTVLLRTILEITSSIPLILLLEQAHLSSSILSQKERQGFFEIISIDDFATLMEALDELRALGLFNDHETTDSEFVRLEVTHIDLRDVEGADIFLKLAPHRYCRRFKKEDHFDSKDLEKAFRKKAIDFLYIRRTDIESLLEKRNGSAEKILSDSSSAESDALRMAALENLDLVHNLAHRIGFTPQVQELAKRSVALITKALGNSPKLSEILGRLGKHKGKYISSHSLMLAEIACAVAARAGLNSASTFMKLSLAAFMHDLSLTDNRLAQCRDLSEVEQSFSGPEVHDFRFHPLKGAEYVRKFHQIPPEVDTIVLQHHERPNGTGFPRGLYCHQISPLSCLFIVAQDLLDYYLKFSGITDELTILSAFLSLKKADYQTGTFKKLLESLETGAALKL